MRAIADRYISALAEHEPAAARAVGRSTEPVALADLSPEWLEERYALQGELLAILRAMPSDAEDGALRAALIERFAAERALFDTGYTMQMVAVLASPVHLVLESVEGLAIDGSDSGQEVLRRIEAGPQAVHQYKRSLVRARALGREGRFSGSGVAAGRQIRLLADQIDRWVATDYFGSVPRATDLDDKTKRRCDTAARAMNVALADLSTFLREDLLPTAPTEDAVGARRYAVFASSMLGTEVDLRDVYAFGWAELERLTARAREIALDLGGHGPSPVTAAASLLDVDPRYRLEGVQEIQRWLTRRVAESTLALQEEAFALPPSIEDVDCLVSQAASGVVYYTPALPRSSEPSRIVWTIPSGTPTAAIWREATSVNHEGVPGHHLEHAVTRGNPNLHPWQRYLCEIHGYAEGWAHYAESLADELGLIRDPAERLGMVLGQVWRSVRIVADIGLHTGWDVPPNPFTDESRFTPALARFLLEEYALVEPPLARFEVDRYLGVPGQALAFKVGAKLWTDAREAWFSDRGAKASLSDFHRESLALGPMGLGPLKSLLLAR